MLGFTSCSAATITSTGVPDLPEKRLTVNGTAIASTMSPAANQRLSSFIEVFSKN